MLRFKVRSQARAVGKLRNSLKPNFDKKNSEDSLANWKDDFRPKMVPDMRQSERGG